MIQKIVEPILATVAWSNHFLCDFISDIIVDISCPHSALQLYCSLLTFVGTAVLKSRLLWVEVLWVIATSVVWQHLVLSFSCLTVLLYTEEFMVKVPRSCACKIISNHHPSTTTAPWQMVWVGVSPWPNIIKLLQYEMVFVLLCNFWSSPNMAMCIIAKISPIWSCMSKGHCSWSVVVCSDAAS